MLSGFDVTSLSKLVLAASRLEQGAPQFSDFPIPNIEGKC